MTPDVFWWDVYGRQRGLCSLSPADSLQGKTLCGLSHVIQKALPAAIADDPPVPPPAFRRESGWADDSYTPSGLDLGSNYQGLKLHILYLLTPVKYLKKF